MTDIKKAWPDDFERVFPLLMQFQNPYLKKEHWQRLFANPFGAPEEHVGVLMTDGDRAVGFLGLLFSRREAKGQTLPFCNMTSWIVEPPYRGKSLFMLLPVLKEKGYTFTDLTPSPEVHALLEKAGFQSFETGCRVIIPVPHPGKAVIRKLVRPDELSDFSWRRIMTDHLLPDVSHWLIESDEGSCYVLATRMSRRKAPFFFGRIHHVSNPPVFQKHIRQFTGRLMTGIGALAIHVDERFLEGTPVPLSFSTPLERPRSFRSSQLSAPDTLYSESLILNI